MTKSVNIAEAKAHLSALVDRAAAGEEIILSKAGRPAARLVPLAERSPRQAGIRREWQMHPPSSDETVLWAPPGTQAAAWMEELSIYRMREPCRVPTNMDTLRETRGGRICDDA